MFLIGSPLFSESDYNPLIVAGIGLTNKGEQGPETMNSILGSIRLYNEFQSNNVEVFKENRESYKAAPGIDFKYDQPIGNDMSIMGSVSYGTLVKDHRQSIGSKGSFMNDEMETKLQQYSLKIGYGPFDYLAKESLVYNIGIEVNKNEGPFNTWSYNPPDLSAYPSVTPYKYYLGNGKLSYKTSALTAEMGTVTGGKYFGMYWLGSFQLMQGEITLQSANVNVNSSYYSKNPIQAAYLKMDIPLGLLLGIELGGIVKFSEWVGVKVGGYYVLPTLVGDLEPEGFYYQNGTITPGVLATESAADRSQMGMYGITIQSVTKTHF